MLATIGGVLGIAVAYTATKLIVIVAFVFFGFAAGTGSWEHFSQPAVRTSTVSIPVQFIISLVWVMVWVWYYRNNPAEHAGITSEELDRLPNRGRALTAARPVVDAKGRDSGARTLGKAALFVAIASAALAVGAGFLALWTWLRGTGS